MEQKEKIENKTYIYKDTSENKEYSIYFEIFENILKFEIKEISQNNNIIFTSAFSINNLKEKYKIFEIYDTEIKIKRLIEKYLAKNKYTINIIDPGHLNIIFNINFEEETNEIIFTLIKESTNYYLEFQQINQQFNKQKKELEKISLINNQIKEENTLLKKEIEEFKSNYKNEIKVLNERIIFLENKLNFYISKNEEKMENLDLIDNNLKNYLKLEKKNSHLCYFKKYNTNPKDLKYKMTISTKITVANNCVGDCISAFKTLDDQLLLAYTVNSTIQIYDLIKRSDIKTLDNIGNRIHKIQHYLDIINKRDLLLTISETTIKIYDIKDYSNILSINNAHPNKIIYSGNIIFLNNEMYITTTPINDDLKIFDSKGVHIRSFGEIDDMRFSEVYYSKNDIYILAGGHEMKVYNFETGKLFNHYKEEGDGQNWHLYGGVVLINGKEVLFEGDYNTGIVRIWDFNDKKIMNKISTGVQLNGGLFWNDEYLIFSGHDKNIKIINIKTGKMEQNLSKHGNQVSGVKKIEIPCFGECLISYGYNDNIYLWSK